MPVADRWVSTAARMAAITGRNLPDPGLPDRVHMTFPCRVMRLDVDPTHPDDLFACIEANGTMRSRDRGESWEDCTQGLLHFAEQEKYKSRIVSQTEIEGMLDGHALACSAAAPGSVFLANRMGLFRSDDRGAHWRDIEVGRFSPLTYGRDLRVSPHDPNVLYAALSPAFSSSNGGIFRSDDVGKTWKRFDHGVKAEATMMAVAVHPRDPQQVVGVSKTGQGPPETAGTAGAGRDCPRARATATRPPAADVTFRQPEGLRSNALARLVTKFTERGFDRLGMLVKPRHPERQPARRPADRHCQVEAFWSEYGGARTVVMPRWSRCAIAPPLLIGRSEASTGRRDGAGG